jgi:hypothetical protein
MIGEHPILIFLITRYQQYQHSGNMNLLGHISAMVRKLYMVVSN